MTTTTAINLVTRLDSTDFQAAAADDLCDLLEQLSTMWADRRDVDRRRLLTYMEQQGMPATHAEECVEAYHRAIRLMIDATAATARTAKAIGDAHATMMGRLNIHRRSHGQPPVSGVDLR
jgi:hypothetical protein